MRRKTNLFYSEGTDSKFLTFSNYTESLTGNFLSTDTKIYPSTFLCLNIPSLLNNEKKKIFINDYLIGYYENKLAFLRDKCIDENTKPENNLLPLAYLFDTILKYISINDTNIDTNNLISYISDITEQDFNGTYTDTICIIDFAKYYKGTINSSEKQYELYGYDDINSLYGWKNKNNEYVENIHPMFDEEDKYRFVSEIDNIELINSDESEIKFNIVIPLYDLTNINYKSNTYFEIENNIENTNTIELQFNENYKPTQRYVPLGIWFSDSEISLTKDLKTGFSQTWSLLISSQFKPFPYTNKLENNVDIASNSNAFPTFAMVMNKQNDMIESFSKMQTMFAAQTNEIQSIKSELSNKSYENNLDKLKREFINFEYEMTNKFNSFKQEVMQILDNLKWNTTK